MFNKVDSTCVPDMGPRNTKETWTLNGQYKYITKLCNNLSKPKKIKPKKCKDALLELDHILCITKVALC